MDAAVLRRKSWIDTLAARPGLLFASIALGAVILIVSGLLAWATASGRLAPAASPSPASPDLELPPSLEDLVQEYPELAVLLNDPALSSVYKDFLVAYETGGFQAAQELASLRGLLNERNEIRITLVLEDEIYAPPVSAELQAAGITVEGSYRERINVGVPMALIQQLAEERGIQALFQQLAGLDHIVRIELPVRKRIDRVGRVEGMAIMPASAGGPLTISRATPGARRPLDLWGLRWL